MTADISKHALVPKHTKVSDSEKDKICAAHNINSMQLPKIFKEDPAISKLGVKAGDVIKIERHSKTAGVVSFYRVVIDE
ncbi:DNA-directed RNA polymerase subunit H [Candidatus Woesearchaeota archaeon]|jgi:DNA-directed RNA polymerase subunit H (RpoH/RPB5)|nr:DNA-directed RNA polymerase subunit H [Candidatus Woesearchaeota archaeon]MBT5397538.1 DNA-directed RNA polymerase subunit H [Candidatus Woesearchaeota archaeon]MBT5924923.1 DNA-directed RNA polymerase subunit H [Candidatus Woesearchaeota archaeon]MBT6367889.1 DNA-directed RNA polymerase subunit H [Candidatus Woesearchaeota archaeon]MBT7763114.1 DNA-directed RNA polymerase subunit H [Candidatus Woesearchaeota archaeon]